MLPPPPPQAAVTPFLFPQANSTVLPDPSTFFSHHLLSNPLPTNSFFQNFVLKNGDKPEYIHPYLIKSSNKSSLSLSYPSLFKNSSFIYQIFIADLIISTLGNNHNPNATHVVSSYSDLSVTLDFPSSKLRFFLVRGSPFLTCNALSKVLLSISTAHAVLELTPNRSRTKYTIKLNNTQTWLLYASSPVNLSCGKTNKTITTSSVFSGVIRIAALPNKYPKSEAILDRFSSCYPVSGNASLTKPFHLEYKWDKEGRGDLLMLAHPLHRRLLSVADCSVSVLEDFKYNSIDGELVGVVGDSWVLKTDPVTVTWNSTKGVEEESRDEIIRALVKDANALNSSAISTNSSYFYGKLVARAARLALIAEELHYDKVIPTIKKFLKDMIEPWLEGTFSGNGFLYDPKWGGLVTKLGSLDSTADFGFGIFNDHHYHIGYFIYGISVLAKLDSAWGRKYRPQSYAMMADYMNSQGDSYYTRLRCFDFWKLHSWASGLTEFPDGRNQESTSEAVNAYYSAALMGRAYGDSHLVSIGSTILAFEIKAAQMWWHVEKYNNSLYPKEFTRTNRVVGILWANKRDSSLWFAPAKRRDCRLGIQLLPLLPVSEVLFSEVGYVKELVNWTWPALGKDGVEEGWKGFAYALQGVYDKENALDNIRKLKGHDDGNSLTNLLWWVYSRGDGVRE